jgi:type VI secretion system secreted protein Hcp
MKTWIHSLVVVGALVGVAVGPFAQADAALNSYLRIKGQKAVEFKGKVQKGQEGALKIISFNHEIVSPRDPASGLPTGKRMHKPLTVTCELGQETPQLYKLMIGGELLPEVELAAYAPGGKTPLYTVKLYNATISQLRAGETLEVAFTYQKIEWTWVEGNKVWQDDWLSPNVAPPAPKPLPAKK